MSLSQNQIDALFEVIPSDESILRQKEGKLIVHYYSGGYPDMKTAEFKSYDDALKHFKNGTMH